MGTVIPLNDFTSFTDEELVEMFRDGHKLALDFLLNKYKLLVEKKARTYFLIGASRDDIIQEGMIGLFKAVRDYKNDKQASFYSFADLCITRQMITAVKASTRQKHMPLNSYISLNKPAYEEDNDKTEYVDKYTSKSIINPEDLFIGRENLLTIESELSKRLSKLEKQVIQLYVDGVGYIEIAEILERPVKSIDNALQRIKKKVEQIIIDKNI